jgi:hypothetical protein
LRGLERLVADLLADLAMLTVEEQHGTTFDEATWRVAAHNLAGLHQLVLAVVHE